MGRPSSAAFHSWASAGSACAKGSSSRSCQPLDFSTLSMRSTASHQRCANWHKRLLHAHGVQRFSRVKGRVAVVLGPHAVRQEHMPVEVELEITRHSLRHADRRALHRALHALQFGIAPVVLVDGPHQRLVDCVDGRGRGSAKADFCPGA